MFNIIQATCISIGKAYTGANCLKAITKRFSYCEMGLRPPCSFSQRGTTLLLVIILLCVSMLRQRHRRNYETFVSFSLPRHLSTKEVPDNLLGAHCPHISWNNRSQFHNNFSVYASQILMG